MSTSHIEVLNNPPLEKQEDNPNKLQDENRPDQEGNQELASNLAQSQPNKVEPAEAHKDDKTQNINEPLVAEKPKSQEKHVEEKKPEEHAKPDDQEIIQKTPEISKPEVSETEQQAPTEQKEEKQVQENNGPKPEILITETKSEKAESLKESRVEEQKPSPSLEVKTSQKSSNLDVQDKKDQTLTTVNSLVISQAQRPDAHSPAARESDHKKVPETLLLSPKSDEKAKKDDKQEKQADNTVQNKEDLPKENNQAISKEDPVEQAPQNENKPQEQEAKEDEKVEKAPESHTIEEADKTAEKVPVQELENPEAAIISFISPNKAHGNESSDEINAQLVEAFKATPLVAKSEHNEDAHDKKETQKESVKQDTEDQVSPKQEAKKEKKEKNAEESENPEKPKKKKKEKTPVQEDQQTNNNITEAISAFISPAKLGSDSASNEINTNLAEAFQGTSLVSKKKQTDIDPDDIEGVTGFAEEDEERKEKKSDHETKSPKIQKQKSEKSPTGKAQTDKKPSKIKNEIEIETALETQSTAKNFKSQSPKKPAQLKVKVELAAAAMKKKNTMEEHLRLHKMQEMSRWKKQLEGKLEAITEQMVSIAQTQSEERSTSLSPEGSAKKKVTKEQIAEKQKKAGDLAKRMQMERKEMEKRKEKRRDVRQAIVLKEIDLVHQRQLDSLELVNGAGSARARFENDVTKLKDKTKQESIFAALEEKKYEIKVKREFNKVTESDTNDMSDGSPSLERINRKEGQHKIKMPKKQAYRSPVLNKVLQQDAEIKKIEWEQKERRRLLHERKVGYGKEIRDSFFPALHPLKQADSYQPIMDQLYSPNRVKYHDIVSPTKSKEQIKLPHIEKRESPAAKSSQKSLSNMDELFKPKRKQTKQHQKDKEEYEEFVKNDANYEDQVDLTEEELETSKRGLNNSKSSVNVAPRNKSLPAAQRKKQSVAEAEVDDYGYESHHKKHQKIPVQKREPEIEEEQNEWEQELEADQEMMKEKIAAMLGDIKKMETQIKRKEERMLKDMEKKMTAKAHG